MAIIDDLRTFILTCPFLRENETINAATLCVDYIGQNAVTYSIGVTPATAVVKRYTDGGGVGQLSFTFSSLEYSDGAGIETNVENARFYEEFALWLKRTKPAVPGWIKVEPLTCGYMFESGEGGDRAVYRIQCRVLYYFDFN